MNAVRHAAAALVLLASAGGPVFSAAPDFDRDIRPILSDRCYLCHGPDAQRREADLRLDVRENAVEWVIVPSEPDESELIARITSDDPDLQMPPPGSNLALSKTEQETLRAWIAAGAPYAEHWAFTPLPESVDVPGVAGAAWPRRTLDRFILARLESQGLTPSPPADAVRFLRRLSLDLTGLPPTREEIREFAAASAQDELRAWEAAVDRLLADPGFGEHMAVAWLDAARYADSYGYQSDQLNGQWPYRDWVVRALNANLPFDAFLTHQLAGDLLPDATRDEVLATAFNRLHRMTNEGGSIAEEWLAENAADRVHTVGTAVLGLTLECARCHDHKYDPISQRDYYSLTAFFNSIDESGMYDNAAKTPTPSLLLPTDDQEQTLTAARMAVADAETGLSAAIDAGQPRFLEWLEALRKRLPAASLERSLAEASERDLLRHVTFDESPDDAARWLRAVVSDGTRRDDVPRGPGFRGVAVALDGDVGAALPGLIEIDRWQPFTVDLWLRDTARSPMPVVVVQQSRGTDVGYNGFDLMLADGSLQGRLYRVWPGNAIGVQTRHPIAQGQWHHVTVTYDGSSRAAGLCMYIDGERAATDVVRDKTHKSAAAVAHGDGAFTVGARFRDRGFRDGAVDELRVYGRTLAPLEIHWLHETASGDASVELRIDDSDEPVLRDFYFTAIDGEVRAHRLRLAKAWRRLVQAEEPIQEIPVMRELPVARPAYLLSRGAYDAPKSDENRAYRDTFAEMLPPFPSDAPRDRLGLAKWLTAPQHPLTARVLVNRVWANFFGRPLVATPENFGRQGETPSHPELLDWLARDFVDHGWDLKRLCRNIALSATYRQDSRLRPELREDDPENVWLARGPRRRLTAEQVRGTARVASGLLDRAMGGPPVSPYQPGEDLWREANAMSPPYRQATGQALHRRSLYSVWKRTAPLPNMLAFDAVTRETCVVSRSRTNTPLQALVLLNDVQFVEAARALAAAAGTLHATTTERIDEAFWRLTGRGPADDELVDLLSAYDEQLALFAAGAQQADLLLAMGEFRAELSLPRDELAAFTVVCQIIMNLDATITVR